TPDPPPEVKQVFDAEYPGMGTAAAVIEAVTRAGFSPAGHFTLPDEAWWDDFYTPMLRRIDELEHAYAADAEALAVLADLRREPEMHRRYSYSYGYEFFVARLPWSRLGGPRPDAHRDVTRTARFRPPQPPQKPDV